MSLKILSTAHYVPERVVDNDELSKIMDTMMSGFNPTQEFKPVIMPWAKRIHQA